MSNPIIWLYQLWLFTASITSSGNCRGLKKNQEYSHTFYRVTPNMCIIYRMGSDCLCCLFLVTVNIIGDWLPHVTELPFCTGVELGRCTAPRSVFSQPYGKRTIIWGPFYGFKSKRLFRMNRLHGNTDNISHVPILTWPGMTSSLTSHGSVNDNTWHFSLKFVSYVILSYKNVPLETSMESFEGEPILCKFALYLN